MGTAIAERLLDAGYPLVVNNRTPEKAEALAARGRRSSPPHPRSSSQQVDVVLTSLADDEAFEAVAAAVIAAARPGTVLVDLSTVSPAASARVASLRRGCLGRLRARARERQPDGRARREPQLHRLGRRRTTIDRVEPVHPRDRPDGAPRRRRRAGADRQARDQPHDRGTRAADVRGARARRGRRRLARGAPRGDGELRRRRSVRQVQDGAARCATTSPRRSRRR